MADENKPNPAEQFQTLLGKFDNDGVRLASQLFDENFRYRETIRTMKEAQPKEGSVVLSSEDAKEFNKFKQFLTDSKLELKQLKEMVEKFPEIERSNKELSQMETLRELADVGIDGARLKLSVLKDQLQKFPDASISFKEETDKDGKVTKNAYIKTDAQGAEIAFSQFANEKLADYLPALKVSAEAQPPKPGTPKDPKPDGGTSSLFDKIRESVKGAEKPKVDIDARFGKTANA